MKFSTGSGPIAFEVRRRTMPVRYNLSIALLGASMFGLCATRAEAADNDAASWEPFPETYTINDFGGVGLIQTPTARFAPDGQFFFGGSRVAPYERYFLTVQATPWLEATLRYSSVGNRLYSQFPEFSGDQTYKDRGFDVKLKMLDEGRVRPALAFGARDFLGTGLFSSEYFVLNKTIGPVDASFGIAWGNLGSRNHIKNPFLLISDRFRERAEFTPGGGTVNNAYFKGEHAAFFGGLSYDTPIRGLTAKVEYDPNDYQSEAIGNRLPVDLPVNFGLDYKPRSWLQLGASFERGNRVGLKLVVTTNFNKRTRSPKIDPPAPPIIPSAGTPTAAAAMADVAAPPPPTALAVAAESLSAAPERAGVSGVPVDVDEVKLIEALGRQGAGLYSADFSKPGLVTLYVAQARFRNMATGLGRVARAAFSVLPPAYTAVTIVFVESGVETMAATLYR
ncbi:MAG: YjbH domain-containing protein, partial [Sphingomonadaceae bacterium]|nr:YjbH domain-containing protein [Sphingomonadaceae bacterium]